MKTADPNVTWACATVLLVAIAAGLFALAWHGTITGTVVVAVLGPVIGAAVGIFGVHTGAATTRNARKEA